MTYLGIFCLSFSIALSGALAPGPLLATVIAESARHGAKSGPLIILGHALLELIMVSALIMGLARFIHTPLILKTVSFIGASILLYFGIDLLRSLRTISIDSKAVSGTKAHNLVLLGITMSLANPYWALWWMTIGLGLVLGAQKQGIIAVLVFFMGHILADLGWYSIISFAAGKDWLLRHTKTYKAILCICSLTLLGFSLYFFLTIFRAG
jgi:threonine/homoserine/homoserine lactone efflux protein